MQGYFLKKAVADKLLQETGQYYSPNLRMDEYCTIIGVLPKPNRRTPSAILRDYLGVEAEKPKAPEYVNPPYRREFRPLVIRPHLRARDIARDQPPLKTPHGIGNAKQPGGFLPVVS